MSGSEIDENEQKKRGAGKTSLNAIPSGAQKQDYTYSIYSQNPSSHSNQANAAYQSQVPNSFYPTQGGGQYYTNPQNENNSPYSPQPQYNLIPPASTSQFVPINFVPNPGYQSNYKIVPSKSPNGNVPLAILQQPSPFPSHSVVPYPQFFTPNPTNQVNPIHSIPSQGHFNIAPNYQQLSLGNPYLGNPSAMLLLAQPNPSLYNNLLYQNPVQSFYNYYPNNSQAKYSLSYGPSSPPQSNDYEKLQGPITQSVPKEDNDISAQNTEYLSPSDPNSNYKTVYSASRPTSYSKLQ